MCFQLPAVADGLLARTLEKDNDMTLCTLLLAVTSGCSCPLGEGVRGWISMPRPAVTVRLDGILDYLEEDM